MSRSDITDDSGRFEVQADLRGAAHVTVEHPEFLLWDGPLLEDVPVTIQLEAPAVLRGRVLNAAGQPAVGSKIRFDTQGLLPVRREKRVDEAGRFQLKGLRPGDVSVWISGPHGSLGPVELQAGEEEEVVLELGEIRAIRVRVEDASGLPMCDARVVLMPNGERRALESARTDAGGQVMFQAAAATPLTLTAEHPRGLFDERALAGGDREVTLRSLPCGSVVVFNTGDSPLIVDLSRSTEDDPENLRLVAHPGKEIRCSPLAVGSWTARYSPVLARGQSIPVPAAIVEANGRAAAELHVTPQKEVRLEVGAPPTSSIDVALAWPLDRVCAVELRSVGGAEVLARAGRGNQGSFVIDNLPPGQYLLYLCAEGGGRWQDPRILVLGRGEESRVSVSPDSSRCLIVARTTDGAPLPTASARLLGESVLPPDSIHLDSTRIVVGSRQAPAAGADGFGHIHLELIPPGRHSALVSAPGFESVEAVVSSDLRVEVALSPQ